MRLCAQVSATASIIILVQAAAIASPVEIDTFLDMLVYEPFQQILVTIVATNPTDTQIGLSFTSSYQTGYMIDGVYDWADDKFFAQVFTSITIPAYGSYTRQFIHSSGDYFLTPGPHILDGYVVGYGNDSVEFTVIPEPATLALLALGGLGLLRRKRGYGA